MKGFEIAVKEAEPFSVMTSYNLINGIHAANSYDLIQSVLRDEWEFKGFVMTDWFTSQPASAFQSKVTPQYPISASTGCVYAGNDVQMPGCMKNVTDLIDSVTKEREIDGYKVTKADLQFCSANIIKTVIRTMGE